MNDKIVRHEDLDVLRALRNGEAVNTPDLDPILDRYIRAAEADKPALPEGWVLVRFESGNHGAYWHKDGNLYCNDGAKVYGLAYEVGETIDRDLVTLRPSITGTDVAAAVDILLDRQPDEACGELVRDMFRAAGVEVQS
ncbi:hypothetical protein ACI3EY_16805 [Ornithinimicrobium sp. LYQ92]|uniref:hypothetical protein n=1 Tax=Serinicoccus sp. LYQ92 TaxID=3378798 RepID=UPI0038520EBC